VTGFRKLRKCSVYGASKWAVQGIAGSLREEARGTGVQIATLCPGSVATPCVCVFACVCEREREREREREKERERKRESV